MELAPDEEARQLAVLTKLRVKQHLLLVESGIARRILDASVPMNYMKNSDDFTEGTLLYPARKKVGDMAIGALWGGEATVSGSCVHAPRVLGGWYERGKLLPAEDMILLGRLDALHNGWQSSLVYAGLQHQRGDLSLGFTPLDNISGADLLQMGELIAEVEQVREAEGLTSLDQETLVNTEIGRHGPTPMP